MFFSGDIQDIPDEWLDVDSLGNYSLVLPFEASFDRRLALTWARQNIAFSVWIPIIYVTMLLVGDRVVMQYKKEPFQLRGLLCAWNCLLASFSIIGFLRTSPEFIRILTRHGFMHSICQTTTVQDQVFAFWAFAFVVSKYFELFDSAFIVLRRRPLTLLHCYHHVTVLVYCCHSAIALTASTRWFCWMNYGVHAVMYTYYAVRAYGVHVSLTVSKSVTALQILQMVVGCGIVSVIYTIKWTAWRAGLDPVCHQSWADLFLVSALYVTYLLLFLRYFIQSYVYPTQRRQDGNGSKTAKRMEETVDKESSFVNDHKLSNGNCSNGKRQKVMGDRYVKLNGDCSGKKDD